MSVTRPSCARPSAPDVVARCAVVGSDAVLAGVDVEADVAGAEGTRIGLVRFEAERRRADAVTALRITLRRAGRARACWRRPAADQPARGSPAVAPWSSPTS